MHIAGLWPSAVCPFCNTGAVEDLKHMWWHCPRWHNLRLDGDLPSEQCRRELPECTQQLGIFMESETSVEFQQQVPAESPAPQETGGQRKKNRRKMARATHAMMLAIVAARRQLEERLGWATYAADEAMDRGSEADTEDLAGEAGADADDMEDDFVNFAAAAVDVALPAAAVALAAPAAALPETADVLPAAADGLGEDTLAAAAAAVAAAALPAAADVWAQLLDHSLPVGADHG